MDSLTSSWGPAPLTHWQEAQSLLCVLHRIPFTQFPADSSHLTNLQIHLCQMVSSQENLFLALARSVHRSTNNGRLEKMVIDARAPSPLSRPTDPTGVTAVLWAHVQILRTWAELNSADRCALECTHANLTEVQNLKEITGKVIYHSDIVILYKSYEAKRNNEMRNKIIRRPVMHISEMQFVNRTEI